MTDVDKIKELQTLIDNMYISAYYNNDIKTFKKLGIGYVSVPILGRTTKRYIPMDTKYFTLTEDKLEFKELKDNE
jgi:hypothetical protein